MGTKACASAFLIALILGFAAPVHAQIGTGETSTRTLEHDGYTRSYDLYVPAAYDGSSEWPLVISFHGATQGSTRQREIDRLDLVADTAYFLVAYPQGRTISIRLDSGGWTTGPGWNVDGSFGDWDDVDFTSALIEHVRNDYSVDLSRVHSTGYSFGSVMSFALACHLSDRIASIGGVAGPMFESQLARCTPTRPIPILLVHGTADPVVPLPSGGPYGALADPTVDHWTSHNGCTDQTESDLPDTSSTDGSTVTLLEYQSCDGGSSVKYYRVNAGGHMWPGSSWGSGVKNMDINATHEIWRFLSQHPHPQAGTISLIFDVDVSALTEGSSDGEIGVVGSAPPLSWDVPNALRQTIGPHLAGGVIWFPVSSLGPLEYRFVHFEESGGYIEEWSGLSTRSTVLTAADSMTPVVFWNDAGGQFPDRPVIVEPLDGGVALTEATLQWEPGGTGGRFEIEVDDAADFQSPFVVAFELRSTSMSVSVPDTLHTYYWRVRASNVLGSGDWADGSFFTLGTQTVPIEPPDDAAFSDTTTTLTFRWHPYPGATRYFLQISETPEFSGVPSHRLSVTEYVDGTLEPNKRYFWRVKASTGRSSEVWSFVIGSETNTEDGDNLPSAFRLLDNYPNPFNPSTTISYALPQAADVTLIVYDVLGREIRELASGRHPAGSYEVSFDATHLPAGVYFYRLEAGDYVETLRMVVVR